MKIGTADEVVVRLDHDMGQNVRLLLGKNLEEPVAKLRNRRHGFFSFDNYTKPVVSG